MHAQRTPTAVRLLGFTPGASAHLATLLARAPRAGPLYACLHEDSLQEPDIVLAAGSSPAAMAWLDGMRCPPPALVIGGPVHSTYTQLAPSFAPDELYACMVKLLAERRRALALLSARGEPLLAERRRRPRLGPDRGCPDARQPPRDGKVLIVDKGGAFRDHLAGLVGRGRITVAWTDSAPMAVRLCDETPVAVAMINTTAPGIDPYGLSRAIKAQEGAGKTAVVLLVGRTFAYDSTLAHGAGVRGLLDKPVGDRSLVCMLQRLTSLAEMPA